MIQILIMSNIQILIIFKFIDSSLKNHNEFLANF